MFQKSVQEFRKNLMSLGLLLFFLFVLMANVAMGYTIAILLGIGPPNFRTVWTRIKIFVAKPRSQEGGGYSHLSKVIGIVGLMTSFVGRFKKHDSPTSSETDVFVEETTVTQSVTSIPESCSKSEKPTSSA